MTQVNDHNKRMTQIQKWPKFMWPNFRNDPNSDTYDPKWPKFKNDPNSKVTQFRNVPNSEMSQIQKWPKLKNDPNSKITQIQK